MANNFANDSSCKALWRLESGAFTVDSKGTNTLTAQGTPVANSVDFKEGSACVDLPGDPTQQGLGVGLHIDNANLDAGFPLKAGDTSKLITMCGWIKPDAIESYDCTFGFIDGVLYETSQCTPQIAYNSGYYGIRICYNNQVRTTTIQLWNNEWFHVAFAVDGKNKFVYVRVYRASTDTVSTYISTGFSAELNTDANFAIGMRGKVGGHPTYGYDTFGGSIDEVVVFNRFLSAAEIDQIRSGTYGADTGVVAEPGIISMQARIKPYPVVGTAAPDVNTQTFVWKKVAGNPQEGQLNALDMVRHLDRWYMLSCDYHHVDPHGSGFDYFVSEVQDIQSMRRVWRGGPWRQNRYPDSSQWPEGNSTNGRKLVVYKNKIYFALKDQSLATPRIYWTRVYQFDPRAGINPIINIYTASNPTADTYYDSWVNDICIHNDKLYIACCEKIITFDGVSWRELQPWTASLVTRYAHYGYVDYVSLCSHDGKLYVSVACPGEYTDGVAGAYDKFRILVSADNGRSWDVVCSWSNDTYSYYDDTFTSLTSFNDNIYMVCDAENTNRSAIYKLVGGKGSPVLVKRDSTYQYRTYGTLFTSPYDYDSAMYIGSHNSIKIMNTSEVITDDIVIKPTKPTYFSKTHPTNLDDGRLYYVGGQIGWISGVSDISPTQFYYTEAYYKDFTPANSVSVSLPKKTVIKLDKPPKVTPPIDNPDLYDPIDPPPMYLVPKGVNVVTTEVVVEDVSIVLTPSTLNAQLTLWEDDLDTSSLIFIDLLSLSFNVFNAHATVVDSITHDAPLLSLSTSPIEVKGVQYATQLGGPHCVALWNFEPGALTIDSKGSNHLTDYYYATESVDGFKRGAGAVDFEASLKQKMQIENANLSPGFPLTPGDTSKLISVCCWIKPETVSNGTTMRIFAKYNYEAVECSFAVAIYSTKIRVGWGTGDSATTYATTNPTLVVGQWYHVGVVANGVGKTLYVRIWDDTAQMVYEFSYTPTLELYAGYSAVTVSGLPNYESDIYGYDGLLDELAIFNNLLTPADIDLIRTSGVPAYGYPEEFGPDAVGYVDCLDVGVTPKAITVKIPKSVSVNLIGISFTGYTPIIKLPHAAPKQSLSLALHSDFAVLTKYVYNMFSDPSLKSRFKFNSGALTTDSIGTNTLTSHGTPDTIASGMPEGNACVQLVPGSTEYYSRTNTNLSTGFPLKSGGSSVGTFTFWFKARVTPTAAWRLGGKYYNTNGGRSLGITHETTGNITVTFGYNSGNSSETLNPGFNAVAGEWYFFALTFDGANKSARGRLYRVSTGTTVSYDMTPANALYLSSSADFGIGAWQGTGCYDGQIDDWCVWNKRLSDTEIDLVRAFSGSVTYIYNTMNTHNVESTIYDPLVPVRAVAEPGLLESELRARTVTVSFGGSTSTITGRGLRLSTGLGL